MRPGVRQPKAGGARELNPCRAGAGVATERSAKVSPIATTPEWCATGAAGGHGVSCRSAQIAHVDGSCCRSPSPSGSPAGCTATCWEMAGSDWRSITGATANASVRAVMSAKHSRRRSERWVFNESPVLGVSNDTPFPPKGWARTRKTSFDLGNFAGRTFTAKLLASQRFSRTSYNPKPFRL
jgi:hypothetical protein